MIHIIKKESIWFIATKKAGKTCFESDDFQSKRIGVGKGIIEDPTDFDKWNDEIADLFEDIKKWII